MLNGVVRHTYAAITAAIASASFYESPEDPSVHKVVATITFSHVVDEASLARSVKVSLNADGSERDLKYELELSPVLLGGRRPALVSALRCPRERDRPRQAS